MTLTIIDGMTSLGWSFGGGPGSVKKNSDGWVIARNLDQDWQADIAKVIAEQAKEKRAGNLVWVVSQKALTPGGSPQSQVLAVFTNEAKAWKYKDEVSTPIFQHAAAVKFIDLQIEGPILVDKEK